MKGAYTPEFTPVARPGQLLEIDDGSTQTVVQVDRFAPLPAIETQVFSIPDGETKQVEVEALHTDSGYVAQYRPTALTQELPDDVEFTISQASQQDNLYTNQAETSSVTNETPYELVDTGSATEVTDLTHLLELFQFEDDDLYFEFTNTSGTDPITFTLTYSGFNYRISPAPDTANQQPVYVPTAAVRGGTNTRV